MAPVDTCKALWVGGFVAELPDASLLVPGETELELPRGEAEASEFWQVLDSDKAPTKDELAAQAAKLELEVEGTGKGGAVLKSDLEQALAAAEAAGVNPDPELDPSAEGEGDPSPEGEGDPSVETDEGGEG